MENRITAEFKRLRREGRGGFVPFVVAGDPDLETTKAVVRELARIGASVIELGVPFSDPVADGPTIQEAAQRALRNRISIEDILGLVADLRKEGCETPVILFSYFNPVLQYGIGRFAEDAEAAGVDGCLITDLIPEEAAEFRSVLTRKGLDLIMLAAPTSSDERLEKICGSASGFVYAVSRAGITGARSETSGAAEELVARIRKFTDLPVAVGFGISSAGHVRETWKYADAAVVGSAIVAEISRLTKNGEASADGLAGKIGEFASSLVPD